MKFFKIQNPATSTPTLDPALRRYKSWICIQNEKLCIKNQEICIKIDELCI